LIFSEWKCKPDADAHPVVENHHYPRRHQIILAAAAVVVVRLHQPRGGVKKRKSLPRPVPPIGTSGVHLPPLPPETIPTFDGCYCCCCCWVKENDGRCCCCCSVDVTGNTPPLAALLLRNVVVVVVVAVAVGGDGSLWPLAEAALRGWVFALAPPHWWL